MAAAAARTQQPANRSHCPESFCDKGKTQNNTFYFLCYYYGTHLAASIVASCAASNELVLNVEFVDIENENKVYDEFGDTVCAMQTSRHFVRFRKSAQSSLHLRAKSLKRVMIVHWRF